MPKNDKPRRGRPQINHEQIAARFPEGTIDRMDTVLIGNETLASFIREAVEREIKRRQRATK